MSDLTTILIIYRENDTMSLWGITERMRPNQQPADLLTNRNARASWIWLGSPGYWGALTLRERTKREAFVKTWRQRGAVPESPNEWNYLEDFSPTRKV